MFQRIVSLEKNPAHSIFLWGPRKTGKSTLLKSLYPTAFYVNLLDTDQFTKYSLRPATLREELLANVGSSGKKFCVIDEIQKVPALLDEVHLLIEDHEFTFCLCGSSARKLKRSHANLLGGRAIVHQLRGLVYPEFESQFDFLRVLNRGTLPSHYLSQQHKQLIRSYVNQYLKEEIADEGLVRRLPVFSNFLRAAAFSDTEIVNFTNISRDCGVSGATVREYFQILMDTLVGEFLPAYVRRAKRKVIHAPKFYFFDLAIPNLLTQRSTILIGSESMGKVFENWIFHELKSYVLYRQKDTELSYWKLADSGKEVDFIINDFEVVLEAKTATVIHGDHLKGIRELTRDHPNVAKRKIVICLEAQRRLTEDKILIVPALDFVKSLWQGEWF
jgi:predicted AAA+ superfamily ATPase